MQLFASCAWTMGPDVPCRGRACLWAECGNSKMMDQKTLLMSRLCLLRWAFLPVTVGFIISMLFPHLAQGERSGCATKQVRAVMQSCICVQHRPPETRAP
eukprot:18165-Pelagomonas_calceolata.AAC.4